MTRHILVSPFQIEQSSAAGFSSAVLKECHAPGEDFRILSPDLRKFKLGRAEIAPVDGGMPIFEETILSRQFLCGSWQLLHPEAYLTPALPVDVAQEIYDAAQITVPDLDGFVSFLEHNMEAGRKKEELLYRRWDRPLEELLPNSVVHWQDYYFESAINRLGPVLREREIHQTLHIHEAIPESLEQNQWGRSLIRAMGEVDTVFLHTDTYCDRVRAAADHLGVNLRDVKRYDLEIDKIRLRKGLDSTDLSSLKETVPGWSKLTDGQKKALIEVVKTRETVPHRFICTDRVDPIKGTFILYRAIEQFLDNRLREGSSMENLRKEFRFFLLHDKDMPVEPVQGYSTNLTHKYKELVIKELIGLCKKFRGIVHSLPHFTNTARDAMPTLLYGCHGISGSIREGLNLSVMETAWVNAQKGVKSDNTIIIGDGSGFAQQTKRNGSADFAYFPKSGSIDEFVKALDDVVMRKIRHPGALRADLEKLVSREIDPRKSSLLDL